MKRDDEKPKHRKLVRGILAVAGTLSLGLGILGVFLPLLPATPFLLLAAACYLRSSQRFYNWLVGNRLLGSYIKNYLEGKGMPLRAKVFSISLLWITMGYSVIFVVEALPIRVVLALIAIGVTTHILRIRTFR